MDKAFFAVEVEGIAPGQLRVVRFEGHECLSRPYHFEIDAVGTEHALPLEEAIGRHASLTIGRGKTARKIHGILQEAEAVGESDGGSFAYVLRLVPRLALLGLSQHHRSFGSKNPMTVFEVIDAVLRDPAGLGFSAADYSLRLQDRSAYQPRDFWVQYGESDAAFLNRLVEHWGLFYYFEQDKNHEHLVFTDSTTTLPAQTPPQALAYQNRQGHGTPHGQDLQTIRRRLKAIPKSVRLRDYNGDHPQLELASAAAVRQGTFGEYDDYGAHVRNPAEGDFLARVRAEEFASARDRYLLRTQSPFVTAGHIARVEGHARGAFNQRYVPVSVRHSGAQPLADGFSAPEEQAAEPAYHNDVEAIPATAAFRSPRITPRPAMSGLSPAMIEVDEPQANSNRAALDAQGRYKVAFDFDTTENPVYQRSPALRRMQPYGGRDVGMHFPLLKETEVMIGWLDGDPDRPLILGAVPNAQTVGPVSRANHTENKLRTASGIALVMNDGPGLAEGPGSANPQAGTATARAESGGGVYSALVVPSTKGMPAHYLRLGDVAAGDGLESQIIAHPAFGADRMAYRGSKLTDAAYGGIFAFTGGNHTRATAGHETLSTGGDLRQVIGGSHIVATYGAAAPAGSYAPSHEDDWTPSLSSAHKVVAINCNTDAYVALLSYVPNITYCDSAQTNFTLGISYTFVGGFNLAVNLGAVFSIQCAPMVEVGTSYEYVLDNKGGMSDGTNFLDSDFSFFATEARGIVLGYRGPSGTPIRAAAAGLARTAMGFSFTGGLMAEAGQGSIIAQQSLSHTKSSVLGSVAQGAATGPSAIAYGACLAQTKSFFDDGIDALDVPNGPGEPTLSITADGITLCAGTSRIQVTETQITLLCDTRSIIINAEGIVCSTGEATLAMEGNEVQIEAEFANLVADTINLSGDTDVAGDLAVEGDISAVGEVAGANINAGL